MTKTAIYARFSSDNQRETSIDDQLRVCRDYCAKNSLTVTAEYFDKALTGRTDDRPQFQQMITDGEHKRFDVLVLYALDRFSRNIYDSAVYKHRLTKAGIRIIYATQPLGEGPEATLMESVLTGLAAYYSENLARSVRRGLEGKALRGEFVGGGIPYGYRIVNSRYTIDPTEAPVVQEIFDAFIAGESRAAIMRSLNSRGIKTRRGNPWKENSVFTILKNDTYAGAYRFGSVSNPDAIPPIISQNTYDRAQQIFARNKTTHARHSTQTFLLTGKLYCAHCNKWLTGDSGTARNGATHYYYTCSTHKKSPTSCPQKSIRQDLLEPLITNACLQALTDDSINAIAASVETLLQSQQPKTDPRETLKSALRDTDKKINNLLTAIEQGIITPTTKQRLEALESERTALELQLTTTPAPIDIPLTADHIRFYLLQLRTGDTTNPTFLRHLIDTLLRSATVTQLSEGKKIELVFNLKTSSTVDIPGSDVGDEVGITQRHPNRIYVLDAQSAYMFLFFNPSGQALS